MIPSRMDGDRRAVLDTDASLFGGQLMADGTHPVGFGVVGLNWGLGRCRAIQQVPEARLVAVASRRAETARPAGEQLGVDWYADYREMLRRPDLDVVAVY